MVGVKLTAIDACWLAPSEPLQLVAVQVQPAVQVATKGASGRVTAKVNVPEPVLRTVKPLLAVAPTATSPKLTVVGVIVACCRPLTAASTAAKASTMPAPHCPGAGHATPAGRAVATRYWAIWAGVRLGLRDSIRPITPLTCGDAIEVPLRYRWQCWTLLVDQVDITPSAPANGSKGSTRSHEPTGSSLP
jgi:hypothetical protein